MDGSQHLGEWKMDLCFPHLMLCIERAVRSHSLELSGPFSCGWLMGGAVAPRVILITIGWWWSWNLSGTTFCRENLARIVLIQHESPYRFLEGMWKTRVLQHSHPSPLSVSCLYSTVAHVEGSWWWRQWFNLSTPLSWIIYGLIVTCEELRVERPIYCINNNRPSSSLPISKKGVLFPSVGDEKRFYYCWSSATIWSISEWGLELTSKYNTREEKCSCVYKWEVNM